MGQLTAPKTYFEWLNCIDNLSKSEHEKEVLECMRRGSLDWTSGVAERFIGQLMAEINRRLYLASDWLTRDLKHSSGNEELITSALLNVRRRFAFCMDLACLPALPSHIQDEIRHAIEQFLLNVQRSMEDSAASDRTGKLKSILHGNPLTRVTESSTRQIVDQSSGGRLGRRGIIFK